jgi:hypothetical protein
MARFHYPANSGESNFHSGRREPNSPHSALATPQHQRFLEFPLPPPHTNGNQNERKLLPNPLHPRRPVPADFARNHTALRRYLQYRLPPELHLRRRRLYRRLRIRDVRFLLLRHHCNHRLLFSLTWMDTQALRHRQRQDLGPPERRKAMERHPPPLRRGGIRDAWWYESG